MNDLKELGQNLRSPGIASPTPVDVIIDRARRRRRSHRGLAGSAALVILVGMTIAAWPAGSERDPGVAMTGSTTVAGLVEAPRTFVLGVSRGAAAPARLIVRHTADGTDARSIDLAPGRYSPNALGVSRQALYAEHLDEVSQEFVIQETQLADGAQRRIVSIPRNVVNGGVALPSPDQTKLLVKAGTYAYVALDTLARIDLPDLPADGRFSPAGVTWLPDGHRLLAVTKENPVPSMCGRFPSMTPPTSCPPEPPPPLTTRAWTIDTAAPQPAWRPIPVTTNWDGFAPLGPGRLPDSVTGSTRDNAGMTSVVTLSLDGSVIDRLSVKATRGMAVDHTGTQFLIERSGTLLRIDLLSGRETALGRSADIAAWW